MATIRRFEDIEVWQLSRELNNELFNILKNKNQMNLGFVVNNLFKTSGSIMDNIAEGFERDGNKEFRQFLSISKASAGELKSQLYRALDFGLIVTKEFDLLYNKANSVSKQIDALMRYLKNSKYKGRKFSERDVKYNVKN